MRKICVRTLASLTAGLRCRRRRAGGAVWGKIQIAECWHFCIFIDFNLAALMSCCAAISSGIMALHARSRRPRLCSRDSSGQERLDCPQCGLQRARSRSHEVFSTVSSSRSDGPRAEFTPGSCWAFLPQGARSSLPAMTSSVWRTKR